MKSLFFSTLFAFTSILNGFAQTQTIQDLKISNDNLSLTLNSANGSFRIIDAKTNRTWQSVPYTKVGFLRANVTGKTQLQMFMHDSTSNMNFISLVSLDSDSTISFLMDTPQKDAFISQMVFPPAITTDFKNGSLVFSYRSGGINLPQTDLAFPAKRMMIYDNIGLDMPWVGVYDGEKGDGMMVLANTPYDVEMDLPIYDGKMWPSIGWASSLSRFAYPRKVTYVFTSSGRYVSQAKHYRNYEIATGNFKSLKQKIEDKPLLNRLVGASVVWGSEGLRFAKQAKTLGVNKLMIMGNKFDAHDLREMTKLGYLNSTYENMEGTREGPMGHMKDTMAIAAYHTREGKAPIGWVTKEGVEYYSRSSVRSLFAMKRYLPAYLQENPLTGLFLDVTPAFLLDDYHPLHTFNREMDKNYKNQMKDYISNTLGLVVGGEHGKAWSVSHLDYSEGPMTGSFFWENGNKPGYLEPPKDSTYMPKDFKKYGWDFKRRIPLWQLVFNDAVSSTWYWGDSSGWFYGVDPKNSDLKDNYNLLSGTMPLMWADEKGYGWNRNRDRFLQTIRNVTNFQEKVATSELLTHQFLNSDSTLQYSKFANGATVYVSFADEPISVKIDKKNVSLAPRGFYVTAPGFKQTKTVDKGIEITQIVSDSLYSVSTDSYKKVDAISTNGKVTAFKVAENHWRIVTETPESASKINLKEVLNIKGIKDYAVNVLNENGRRQKKFIKKGSANELILPAEKGIKIYDLTW